MVHAVKQFQCCGRSLLNTGARDFERQQMYDIPPIKMQVTEHRGEIKNCPHCHTVNKALSPQPVNQPVQNGNNVQQLAVYFTRFQLLPYRRTSEILYLSSLTRKTTPAEEIAFMAGRLAETGTKAVKIKWVAA